MKSIDFVNPEWAGFKGEDWKNQINVSDFILNNFTEYKGDKNDGKY